MLIYKIPSTNKNTASTSTSQNFSNIVSLSKLPFLKPQRCINMTIEQYKNGKLEGLRTVFYPDGKVAEETNYKNNTKEGPSKIYTQKGIVIEETVYKNGNYNGLAIFRDTDGNDVSKGYFVDGKKSGKWLFYEKGKLVKETNMSYPEKKLKIK